MVSETKQSLQDQKRLQYLENLYKNKIDEDEKQDALQYKSGLRRLQSAQRWNPHVARSGPNSSMVSGLTYADQIAQKYKHREQSAHGLRGKKGFFHQGLTSSCVNIAPRAEKQKIR